MDNYSKEQLTSLDFIRKFIKWLRERREGEPTISKEPGGKPERPDVRGLNLKNYARKNDGLDDDGNIKIDWAEERYKTLRDKEDLTQDEIFIRKALKNFLTEENPESLF